MRRSESWLNNYCHSNEPCVDISDFVLSFKSFLTLYSHILLFNLPINIQTVIIHKLITVREL